MANENELYHYGVIGMKWGVSRYQNKDGSLTAEGRKHYDNNEKTAGLFKSKSPERRKSNKAEDKVSRKEAKAEKEKVNQEKLKEQIIAKGDYKQAIKHMEIFTNAELDQVIQRNGKIAALKDISTKDLKTQSEIDRTNKNAKVEKFERIGRVIQTASNIATNSTNFYNSIAKASNALTGSNLPIIGEKKEAAKRGVDSTKTVDYESIPGNPDYVMKTTKVTTHNSDGTTSTSYFREMERA